MKKILVSIMLTSGLCLPGFAFERTLPIIKVQAVDSDYRVSVLEEQLRQLSGKMEELNFQLLEMQELIRRMRMDNEYRFQQLEGDNDTFENESKNTTGEDDAFIRLEKLESDGTQQVQTARRRIDGVKTPDGEDVPEQNSEQNTEQMLGTIRFDANGNVIDSTLDKPLDLTAGFNAQDSDFLASIPQDGNGFYKTGYELVQAGRYEEAEVALIAFSQRFANHPRLPEARFWLGESYLGQGQFKQAAEVYFDVQKRWPNNKIGPRSLLKLGVAIARLNQTQLACATFLEVLQKYPDVSHTTRRNLAFEQRAAKCETN